ncbi:MAG: DNA alkylation repair protein [Sphingobacteriia bacterium]|nr:DNA alkylation repair protein [Sphingobacteriia bacterium]
MEILKQNPSIGLPVLELLKADSSRYVQNSVGNWLNDASKTQPEWVLNLVHLWQLDNNKYTNYICKRAIRSLKN